ncbi:MAG: RNA-binding S4 domain-containing protein [Chloroflexota bacterium]
MEVEKTIRLDQFLKMMGLVSTGGEAKVLIQSGEVLLNGDVEIRRKKKIRIGDEVELFGEKVTVSF